MGRGGFGIAAAGNGMGVCPSRRNVVGVCAGSVDAGPNRVSRARLVNSAKCCVLVFNVRRKVSGITLETVIVVPLRVGGMAVVPLRVGREVCSRPCGCPILFGTNRQR